MISAVLDICSDHRAKKPLGLMQIKKKTQEKRSTLRNEELERTKRQYNFF